MTNAERKIFGRMSLLGAAVTLVVMAATFAGWLAPLEHWIYDRRARHFQHWTPKPTESLVHYDIDDNVVDTLRWPMRRERWAEIVGELRRAGAKAIGFDVFFSNASPFGEADDRAFAEAMREAGNFVLGVPLKEDDDASRVPAADRPAYQMLVEAFRENLEVKPERLTERLQQKYSAEQSADYVARFVVSARERAMFLTIFEELRTVDRPVGELKQKLIGRASVRSRTLLERVFEKEYQRVLSIRTLLRLGIDPPANLPPLMMPRSEQANLPMFNEASAASGFVDDYLRFEDGVIRSLPMWVNYRGKLFGQFGLVLACKTLDVPLEQVQIGEDEVVLPAVGQLKEPVRIPVHTREGPGGTMGTVIDVPWFGFGRRGRWEEMYDYERKQTQKQHYSVLDAWTVWDTRRKVEQSVASVDKAILIMLGSDTLMPDRTQEKVYNMDPEAAARYAKEIPPIEDTVRRGEMARHALKAEADLEYLAELRSLPSPTDHQKLDVLRLTDARRVLENYLENHAGLVAQLRDEETRLRWRVEGKAVLIGFIAEGTDLDLVPTPLHAAAPGVIVHGAVFNAIMTGDFWKRAPGWVSYALIGVIGAVVTLLAARLPPWQSLAATGLVIVVTGFVDALLVFDWGNVILDAAGPAVAAPAVWSAITVVRFIVERAERDRITSRFRTYVDPALVEYVIENPEKARLEGQEREMTVVFTDLGGFTTLTEQLGKGTVPILNDYMSLMVPIIRRHGGYVNKFLGDGIMFFFGAPKPTADHSVKAVEAVMEMQAAMPPFNEKLRARDLPTLTMRVGINTGEMIVGDAGPADGSDYTVLGDSVNLSARLESANKRTGTLVMIGQRTAELVKDRFLLLPLALLQVKGKSEGVMTYTPLARIDEATEEQKARCELQGKVVECFKERRFGECLELLDAMEERCGSSKVVECYREEATEKLQACPEGFDGTIVMTEK